MRLLPTACVLLLPLLGCSSAVIDSANNIGGPISRLRGGAISEQKLSLLEELVEECVAANRKVVVVTGGVLSGIGKGVTASSVGVIFRAMGLRVTALKIDPYLNVDAGTMSPLEHGEVFVLDDGGETDLDLGNYERFLSVSLTSKSNLSTGKIYQSVIERERVGDYLGKTVQVVPHVSDAIQEWVLQVAREPVTEFCEADKIDSRQSKRNILAPEICVVELGGTLGDIESMPFVEALRQLQEKIGYKSMCFIHVSLVPSLGTPVAEQKTKPTQHSVQRMMQLGLRPDFLCCRGKEPLGVGTKKKLSLFTSVSEAAIISLHDVSNIYRVPLMMIEQNLPSMLSQRLRLQHHRRGFGFHQLPHDMCKLTSSKLIEEWTKLADSVDEPESECTIAMVGKYCDQGDAYLSVIKALTHSAIATRQRLNIEFIDSSELENTSSEAMDLLKKCDGLVVPGGFGARGFEGKLKAIQYARENKVPFLGICLGMQGAVVEHARNAANIPGAHSAEFQQGETGTEDESNHVIIFMPEGDRERMGGTMRLGARETILTKGSLARKLYGQDRIMERHRHRYEVDPAIVPKLEACGLHFVGTNTDGSGERMEVVEMDQSAHPYFVGAQFHPEFTSRPEKPSPLFLGLLEEVRRQNTSKA